MVVTTIVTPPILLAAQPAIGALSWRTARAIVGDFSTDIAHHDLFICQTITRIVACIPPANLRRVGSCAFGWTSAAILGTSTTPAPPTTHWTTGSAICTIAKALCGRRGRDLVHGLGEILNWNGDIYIFAIWPGEVQAHERQLSQDLRIKDGAITLGRADAGLLAWEVLFKIFVGLIFVAETAHEPAATSADFERIERGLLGLGALHGDGLEDLEEVFAAAILAAAFVVCGEASFIASADVAQLDMLLKLAFEFREQVT